jgi:predicted acyl esterase
MQLTGRTPEDLSHGTLTVQYSSPGALRNPKTAPEDPDNLQTDPVLGFLTKAPGCRQSVAATVPDPTARYTGVSDPLAQPRIFVGLGAVHLQYTLAGATTAALNARVWDVAPDGTTFLMTRGTYRIDLPAYNSLTQPIDLPLFGNQWTLQAGHRVRLDLTQADYPTFLPSNSAGAIIAFPSAQLRLPTREATELSISGA